MGVDGSGRVKRGGRGSALSTRETAIALAATKRGRVRRERLPCGGEQHLLDVHLGEEGALLAAAQITVEFNGGDVSFNGYGE